MTANPCAATSKAVGRCGLAPISDIPGSTASFLVGALASHVLLRLGITDLRLRLPLIVLIAYAVFLALVGVWLRLTGIDAVKVRLDPGRPGEGTERIRDTQASAQGNLLDKAETVADGVSGIGELASIDAEGCLPAVGFAIVAAVIALAALVFGGSSEVSSEPRLRRFWKRRSRRSLTVGWCGWPGAGRRPGSAERCGPAGCSGSCSRPEPSA